CRLYLVSVLLQPDGHGFGLAELVDVIKRLLPLESERLDALLDSKGLRTADVATYAGRYQCRQPIRLIPVDDAVPVISDQLLASVFPRDTGLRLKHLDYSVDF